MIDRQQFGDISRHIDSAMSKDNQEVNPSQQNVSTTESNTDDRFISLQELVTNRDTSLLQARALILDELDLAHTPITGRKIGCVLQTATTMYSGHNFEHNYSVGFYPAEEAAIQAKVKIEPDEPIQRIVMGGKGIGKIKRLAPFAEAYNALQPHFSQETELVLFQPDTFNQAVIFTFDEHTDAYAPQPYSKIEANNREEAIKELKGKTILTEEGLELVADLRQIGLDTGIQFFLTGSASGRGGISQALLKKEGRSYEDIDLIAVTNYDKTDVEMLVEDIMSNYYGTLDKQNVEIDMWFINEVRQSVNYSLDSQIIVSLAVAPSLRDGMVRLDYFTKNFFHQIS